MPAAPHPADEANRLLELRELQLLDSLPEQAYDDLVRLAAQLAGTPISLVSLVDDERQWFKARIGLEAQQTPREAAFCAHAILEPDSALVVEDALADPRFADNPLVLDGPRIRFYAGTPLVTANGHALGTLCVIDTEPRTLTVDQLESLATVARQVVAMIELRRAVTSLEAATLVRAHHEAQLRDYRRQLESRVKELGRLSLHDSLTGLLNRGALTERLDAAAAAHRRSGSPLAVVMVDVDHFKRVNDVHGHAAGDTALKATAQALLSGIREADFVARYGGEEFTVVLTDADLDGALLAAERMRLNVERLELASGPLTASFGVALAAPGRDDTASLLAAADTALYEAKEAGRNTIRFAHAEQGAEERRD